MNYLYSILTVITGNYEKLREINNPNPNVEYVCVTDNPNLKSKTWKIIYKKNIWFLYVKHHQYEFINSNVCLWLDGSYKIINDPTTDFVYPFINSNKEIMISIHNIRSNLLAELCAWWSIRNLSDKNVKQLCNILVKNNMTATTGLFQTSCILTKKTDSIMKIFEDVSKIENECSIDGPYRDDQVIFSYIIDSKYQNWDKLVLMNFETTSLNKFFYMCKHGSSELPSGPYKAKTNICWDKPQKLFKIGIDSLTTWNN